MLKIKSKRKDQQNAQKKYDGKSLVRVIISAALAVAVFLCAVTFENYLLSDKSQDSVLVATKDIPAGTLIESGDASEYFTTKLVNSDLTTANTLENASQVSGKIVTDIAAGEIVSSADFKNVSAVEDSVENPIAITFGVASSERALCGRVRAGDICDVIAIITTEATDYTNSEEYSTVIIENAYIVATYDADGNEIASSDTSTQSVFFKINVDRSLEDEYNMVFSTGDITLTKLDVTDDDTIQTKFTLTSEDVSNIVEAATSSSTSDTSVTTETETNETTETETNENTESEDSGDEFTDETWSDDSIFPNE